MLYWVNLNHYMYMLPDMQLLGLNAGFFCSCENPKKKINNKCCNKTV